MILILKVLSSITEKISLVLGAIVGAQIPHFIKQYSDRLSGNLHEISLTVEKFRQTAALSGKSLAVYIDKFLNSQDFDFINQGKLMSSFIEREKQLKIAYDQLVNSTIWQKPVNFLIYLESDIASKTWYSYESGLNFTLESTIYITLGALSGVTLYWSLNYTLKVIMGCIKSAHKKIFSIQNT